MSNRNPDALPAPRIECRLVGSGGQGVILAGLVLAEAAGVFDGREVAMVQSYGPEARGGASKAEVIISDLPIDYPLCTEVDLLLAMNQEASDAYCWDLKAGAWLIVDLDLVSHPPTSRAVALPLMATARDKLKNSVAANIVALGAISELTGIVTRRALERSLSMRLPSTAAELNRKALTLGAGLARAYRSRQRIEDDQELGADSL